MSIKQFESHVFCIEVIYFRSYGNMKCNKLFITCFQSTSEQKIKQELLFYVA